MGNHAALRHGVNLRTSNGGVSRLSGTYVEIACSGMIYANSMDLLFDWITSVTSRPVIRGHSMFADGGSVPVTVEIAPTFSWTDPTENAEASMWLERLYNISVDLTIKTISAEIATEPLFKGYIVETEVVGHGEVESIEIPAGEPEDWP